MHSRLVADLSNQLLSNLPTRLCFAQPLRNPAAWLTTPHTFELLFLDFLLAFKLNLGKQCQGPCSRRHNIPCWYGSGLTNTPMGTVQVSAQGSRQRHPTGKPQTPAQNLALYSRRSQDVFSWLLWDVAKEIHGIWHLEQKSALRNTQFSCFALFLFKKKNWLEACAIISVPKASSEFYNSFPLQPQNYQQS